MTSSDASGDASRRDRDRYMNRYGQQAESPGRDPKHLPYGRQEEKDPRRIVGVKIAIGPEPAEYEVGVGEQNAFVVVAALRDELLAPSDEAAHEQADSRQRRQLVEDSAECTVGGTQRSFHADPQHGSRYSPPNDANPAPFSPLW